MITTAAWDGGNSGAETPFGSGAEARRRRAGYRVTLTCPGATRRAGTEGAEPTLSPAGGAEAARPAGGSGEGFWLDGSGTSEGEATDGRDSET